jgi:hypothetical protein
VENRGFWALAAPPKRKKQMIHRGLFIGWRVTGLRSNALPAFERTTCVRTHYLRSNTPFICGRMQGTRSTANNCYGG